MNHLIGLRQRIIRAERIVRYKHIQPRFLRKAQRLPDRTGSWCRDHATADQKEIGMVCILFVGQFQYRTAHHLYPADFKSLVHKIRDAVFRVLTSPFLQEFLCTHAAPHLLDVDCPYQPLEDSVFKRHISPPRFHCQENRVHTQASSAESGIPAIMCARCVFQLYPNR